jgi:acyl carrier protein
MDETQAREVIAKALARVAPETDIDTIEPSAELGVEADLDSMDQLHLIEAVSEAIGKDIPDRDYPRTATLESFTSYLVSLTSS